MQKIDHVHRNAYLGALLIQLADAFISWQGVNAGNITWDCLIF